MKDVERCKLFYLADNTFQGFVDLNDNEKVHILLSNINIVRKTSNYLNEVLMKRTSILKRQ